MVFPRIPNWAKTLARLLVALLVIGIMLRAGKLDLAVVKEGFTQPGVVLGCWGLLLGGLLLGICRWRLLLRAQTIHFSFFRTMRYTFIGTFFNTTMPGLVSGDVIKAWYATRDLGREQAKTPLLLTIFLDRVIGLFGLITLSLLSLAYNFSTIVQNKNLHVIAGLNILLGAVVVSFYALVMLSNHALFQIVRQKLQGWEQSRICKIFLNTYDAFSAYRHKMPLLVLSLVMSGVTHSCIVTALLFCSRALGESHIEAFQIFLLAPIGFLLTAVPLAPAGLGVGQVAFESLFAIVGSSKGADIFTFYITLSIVFNLSLGAVFYLQSFERAAEASRQR